MNLKGSVFQINVSNGGVPKLPRPEALVSTEGLAGDRHHHLQVHGGVERALCLYSLEKILALQEEGHPIFPGAVGENVTVAGVDWSQLAPGMRLSLGDEVLVEIRRFVTPCKTIAPFFIAGEYERISQTHHPGWARLYARVLQPGVIRVGDRLNTIFS